MTEDEKLVAGDAEDAREGLDMIAHGMFRRPFKSEKVARKCLGCDKPFQAPSRFIRLCKSCTDHANKYDY